MSTMKDILFKTMAHLFPSFCQWLRKIKDNRDQDAIIYPMPFALWTGIFLFLTKLGARRQVKYEFATNEFIGNINYLSESDVKTMLHPDTLNNVLKQVDPDQISELTGKMIYHLLRGRRFEKYRLLGQYYTIAIDMTGHRTFSERHCDHCLTKKRGGKVIYYYHMVLDAKLVFPNGMALTVISEFVENMDEGASKQDCELKAFYRLAPRLKKMFPQLPICLLFDGLYAAGPVFDICHKHKWAFIITFKEGSMPDVYAEYLKLKQIENKPPVHISPSDRIHQEFSWLNELPYQSHSLNVLQCVEQINKQDTAVPTTFVWITNIPITEITFLPIASGGRLRWKIENEGFNMQKNGGYNLEHCYSRDETAGKNFYLLLQIAHTINQLMEKGSLVAKQIKTLGGIANFTRRLLEDLRLSLVDTAKLLQELSMPFQIRFDSS